MDDRLLTLQQRRLVEVLGTSGPNRGAYLFDLTGAGRDRAREALGSSQYVGPAPVPLVQYRTWVEKQTIRNVHVTREVVREGFRNMVLSDAVHDVLGPSINSAKSLFLYGAPGNGKTMIAETISPPARRRHLRALRGRGRGADDGPVRPGVPPRRSAGWIRLKRRMKPRVAG